jgi:hypothetical protein
MKKTIKQVIGEMSDQNLLIVDGVKYRLEKTTVKKINGIEHGDKIIFKKFDEKEYKENLEIIIEAIKDKVTKEHLLHEMLKNIDSKTLRRLVKRIKTNKPIKRQDGCLGFKIGDAYVQLID